YRIDSWPSRIKTRYRLGWTESNLPMTGWTDIGATNPPEASVDNLTGSDGAHGAAGARQDSISKAPDPEVVVKPQRRRFTAEYKERILEEVDACKHGELGALLRREGLHDS